MLLGEIQAIQNPALGAALLWRFSCGFSPDSSVAGNSSTACLRCTSLGFHARSLEEVTGTLAGSGLRKYEEKFQGRGDILLSLQLGCSRYVNSRCVRFESECVRAW